MTPARRLRLQVNRVGYERSRPVSGMGGVPIGLPRELRWPGGSGVLHVGIGDWPTGLYVLNLLDGEGRTGGAPFVVRPRTLGEARILVVLPTNTWGAYNFRDGATWYATAAVAQVDLTRPFIGGIPPHYRDYDLGFVRWLAQSPFEPDVVADDDIEAFTSGEELRRLYDLVVFSGHEEYVTENTYDVVERYQQLGGNLIFQSANNFFYKVVKDGSLMNGRWRWRDLGRPEAALIGSQYLAWYDGIYRNRPLVVVGAERTPWVFAGTGAVNGMSFGTYGIEIDAIAPSSPPGVEVVAEIPNIFGEGVTAQMTHFRGPSGGQVFDAGVLNFGGTSEDPIVKPMLLNLWQRFSTPS